MMRNLIMTPSQARETIERLSQSALLVNDHGITPDSLIEEYNEALLAFVPRGQLHAWHISMSYQVVD